MGSLMNNGMPLEWAQRLYDRISRERSVPNMSLSIDIAITRPTSWGAAILTLLYRGITVREYTLSATEQRIIGGDMESEGRITEAGIHAFENNQEVAGAVAVKVHLGEAQAKLDLEIVDELGETLAVWEGIEVIDQTRITWTFAGSSQIVLKMIPTLT